MDISPDSFLYNGIDMYKKFHLLIIAYDVLTPQLRARKVSIPMRSGAYDMGANYHEERTLSISCSVTQSAEPQELDELKYLLSRKGNIILWDQPERRFYGQIYEPASVTDYFRHSFTEFTLSFVCDPYKYALEPTILPSNTAIIPADYDGTREAPTRITITNTGTTIINGLQVTTRVRRQ